MFGVGEGRAAGFRVAGLSAPTPGDLVAWLGAGCGIAGATPAAACGRDAQELRQKPAAIAKKINPTLRIPDTWHARPGNSNRFPLRHEIKREEIGKWSDIPTDDHIHLLTQTGDSIFRKNAPP
jgi:hypothetical protein